jgi:HK97 family phage prohead protease
LFEGYASVFNIADAGGDIVAPGAFTASLRNRGSGNIRMLFQHDPAQPIGKWLDIRQDDTGLFVRGRLSLDVRRAAELAGLLRDGAIDGLSIGFKTIRARRDRRSGIRTLTKIDLWEISLVTFPMLASARVTALKTHTALTASLPRDTTTGRQHCPAQSPHACSSPDITARLLGGATTVRRGTPPAPAHFSDHP